MSQRPENGLALNYFSRDKFTFCLKNDVVLSFDKGLNRVRTRILVISQNEFAISDKKVKTPKIETLTWVQI